MKIAIVGYGSIGKRHYRNILKNHEDDIIICSKRNDIPKNIEHYKTINECIKQKPDIAIITNETDKHLKTAIKFANIGCHIFIEKPLSHSFEGVKKLEEISSSKKIVTQIGCNLRFNPCLIKIKKILSQKEIGKIISFQAEHGSYLPDWHPNEDYKKSYAAKKENGGDIMFTSIHEVDYLYWFFGQVTEVFAKSGKYSNLRITSDDHASMFLKFKNGIIGEIHLDYYQRPKTRTCKIIGTNGTIFWNNEENMVKIFQSHTKKLKTILKLNNFDINKMYTDEIRHFKKCVMENKKSINDIKQGIDTLKISLCAKKSSESNKMVKIS